MKICIITSLFEPYSKGGADIIAGTIAKELAKRQNEVVVITTEPNFKLASLAPKISYYNGCKVIKFFPFNIFGYYYLFNKPFFFRAIFHLIDLFNIHSFIIIKKILSSEKPDIIHLHNLKGISYWWTSVAHKLKIPSVFTPHDYQLLEPSGIIYYKKNGLPKKVNWLYGWYRSVNRYLFKYTDAVISPSKFIINFYRKHNFFHNTEINILHNPVLSADKIKLKPSQNILRCIFLGQLEPHKGIIFLCHLFSQLRETNIILDIYGTGSLKNYVDNFAKQHTNINYCGFVANNEIKNAYNKADVSLLPSLWCENCPGVILESFAFGVPVIANSVGGVPELVQDGYNGYLVDPYELNTFKDKILYLNKYRNKIREMSSNTKKYILNFDTNVFIKKLLQIYHDVIRASE